MFKSVVINVVFLFFIFFGNIDGWRTFTFNLTNSTRKVYSNKTNLNVTIKDDSVSMYYTVNEQISHPLARVEIYVQSLDSDRYDMELLNRTIDLCTFFKNSLYEPLLQIIYKMMQEHGNFPESCPVKTKNYYVKDMYLDPERFPPYMPERKGYIRVVNMAKEDGVTALLCESTVYFSIKNSAINRLKSGKRSIYRR